MRWLSLAPPREPVEGDHGERHQDHRRSGREIGELEAALDRGVDEVLDPAPRQQDRDDRDAGEEDHREGRVEGQLLVELVVGHRHQRDHDHRGAAEVQEPVLEPRQAVEQEQEDAGRDEAADHDVAAEAAEVIIIADRVAVPVAAGERQRDRQQEGDEADAEA